MIKDKDLIWLLTILLSVVILFMYSVYFDYKKAEIELSQPKYYIELNQELYELKKVR